MKNLKEKMKNTNGITLVALVVTIIVLLILAAVSLSAVFNQDGIFSRAEQATGKYGQAKARETLELAFGNLQAEKYEARLTVERLDARITEEIGKMDGEEIGDDKSEVIVDGYRFTVDRTVPKIVEELGPADGVIITARITQNGDWENPVATVTGTITKYGGGSVTSSTATATNGVTIPSNFPTTGGSYTIPNITTDTDITITASADVGKPAVTKTIHVRLVDAISIAELKSKINADNYPDYLGMKVNYKPGDTKAWRVFYYDETGEFGDGAGTIYLKRDYDTTTTLSSYTSHVPADGGALMRQLNKEWANSENGKKATSAWLTNEHCASWLCDSTQWTTYKTSEAKYAIGAAPIEMWCKAQNAYKTKYDTSVSTIGCGIKSANGYGYTINGGSLVDGQNTTVVNTRIPQSAVIARSTQWLASPSSDSDDTICFVRSSSVQTSYYNASIGVCPVVSLNH